MNIGFYGHSMAQWDRQQDFSYITMVKNKFNANIVNSGVAQGSAERILFDLKKTKYLDLAIILHTDPDFYFVPSEGRDYSTTDRDNLKHKIPSGRAKDWFRKLGYDAPDTITDFYESLPNVPCYELLKRFDLAPAIWEETLKTGFQDQSKTDAWNDWISGNSDSIKELIKQSNVLSEEIDYYLGLFDALELMKKYLYHHDLQMNRYYGALMQIDQYLKFKNIPVVHCLGKPYWYPKWFKFETGVCDSEIYKLQHEITGYYAYAVDSENNMNEEGNQIAFDMIMPLIKQAMEKVGK